MSLPHDLENLAGWKRVPDDPRASSTPVDPQYPAQWSVVPAELRGEQCTSCGTLDNVVWFTDSVFWNAVIRQGDYVEPALCIPCFVVATAERGYSPTGWRFVPEFHWETTAEYNARRETRT